MDFIILLWNHFRTKLKTFILILAFIYYTYVVYRFKVTDNFNATRQLCLSADNRCKGFSETISVTEVVNYYGLGSAFICVDVKNFNAIQYCFSETKLNHLMNSLIIGGYSSTSLYDYVVDRTIDYTGYAKAIVGIVLVCLILSILFETSYSNFLERHESAFIDQTNITYIKRMLSVGVITTLVLLIQIVYTYSLKYSENCTVPDDDLNSDFCKILKANRVHINSLIFPDDLLVKAYKPLTIFLFTSLLFGFIIYKPLEPPNRAQSNRVYAAMARRNANIDSSNSDDSSEEEDIERATRRSRRRSTEREEVTRNLSISIMKYADIQFLFGKMKLHTSEATCKGCNECAICLCDLFPANDATTANSSVSKVASTSSSSSSSSSKDAPAANPVSRTDSQSTRLNAVLEINCGHIFHRACIYNWYVEQKGEKTCPICRQEIK